ncbi:UvrD-helicase domain-containing protein [Pseudomonas guariconensis]|uniref:UvrD-helicase domain-containing protein n=1 Tax=Pseudomonas guariconensis TaxID=1288410 RepID=UPI002D1F4121|nr:UvrD-helicase domain-containing protein [Pseudomonas guariconensis]MEB3841372.1 UvrD-helicase domain-containing protein [Pseudomonas guariconensis]MEB3874240.1 UvrD-helicase domain-containing protein [Pseudomonas guariconensis]MEB3877330.1 UvrD-helicase domain-containing protein [Pseudomonas guariconensis]MEB3893780.1 UvrD-helicase domain-containing protein [Pseudomonas guariconensis]
MSHEHPPAPAELTPPAQLPWFRRLAARLLGRGLTRLQAQHRDSWFLGHVTGQRSGHADGLREGYERGRVEGYEAGRQVLVIRDLRPEAAAVPGQDSNLFDDWRLPLTAELKKRFKADVAQRLPASAQPSAAQWKLIFSDTPSTCVVAGAGAGKSTSLVLRILLLRHYLGYELDAMTVVTFTRESRKDFIKRLVQVFALWQLDLQPAQARELVRTFHSRILPLVRSLPGFGQLRAFETLGQELPAGGEANADGNPFDLRLNDAQRQQLNLCYRDLLQASPRFAELIGTLRREALQLKPLDPDHPDVQKRVQVTQLAAQRDEELCDVIEDLWFAAGAWPIKGIEPCRDTVQIRGSRFHVHGRLEGLDAWVVLGFDPSESAQYQRPGAKLGVRAEWAVKRTLFQAFCDKPLIWLDNYTSAKRLAASLAGDAVAGPGFEYKVKGELAPAPLLDAFVAAASFIENLGLEVNTAVAGMSFSADDSDAAFFEALALFWKALEAHLLAQSPPVMTYNRMFALFGENNPENLRLLPDPLLRPLAHLMIDEFQDVSPQIVSWLRASLAEIRRRGPAMHLGRNAGHSSLMCVGDDWQSIYGWRGSSPKYFMEFTKAFPSPANTRVMLVENYRSQQHIIDAAEHLVKGAPAITGKKAKASGLAAELPLSPVKVFDRDEAALAETLMEHYARGETVMMLFRRSSDKSLIEQHLSSVYKADSSLPPDQRRLRQLTYHSAKGLQADAVFMLGDCQYLTSSPYKNQAYRMAGLGRAGDAQPFDTAQKEEVQRLAYVAVTRAVRHCYWYVEAANGESAGAPRASGQVAGRHAFFEDLRGQ